MSEAPEPRRRARRHGRRTFQAVLGPLFSPAVLLSLSLLSLFNPARSRAQRAEALGERWMRALDGAGPHRVMSDPRERRLQLVARFFETPSAPPRRVSYREDAEYFYPASAIKLFASLAALRWWSEEREARGLTLDTPLRYCTPRCRGRDRSNVEGGRITLRHELRKLHLVSSNEAFNRVYDLVGHERLHRELLPFFPSLRVHHRLNTFEDAETCLSSPAIEVLGAQGRWRIPQRRSGLQLAPHPVSARQRVGDRSVDPHQREIVEEPLDFSLKNGIRLEDFQQALLSLYRPRHAAHPRFAAGIYRPWLNALRGMMEEDPLRSENPRYRARSQSELRFKPLLQGLLQRRQRAQLRYSNKAGKAYGFHIENAYIEDQESGRSVFITIGLYVNSDRTLNNNRYEYRRESIPLFQAVGASLGRWLAGGDEPWR